MFTGLTYDIIAAQHPNKSVDEPLPFEYIDTVVPAFVEATKSRLSKSPVIDE
jgi:hypothetical protein